MRHSIAVIVALFAAFAFAAPTFRIGQGELPGIYVSEGMRPFVMRAAQDVAGDMEKIFGARPEIVTGAAPEQNAIVLAKAGEGYATYWRPGAEPWI